MYNAVRILNIEYHHFPLFSQNMLRSLEGLKTIMNMNSNHYYEYEFLVGIIRGGRTSWVLSLDKHPPSPNHLHTHPRPFVYYNNAHINIMLNSKHSKQEAPRYYLVSKSFKLT